MFVVYSLVWVWGYYSPFNRFFQLPFLRFRWSPSSPLNTFSQCGSYFCSIPDLATAFLRIYNIFVINYVVCVTLKPPTLNPLDVDIYLSIIKFSSNFTLNSGIPSCLWPIMTTSTPLGSNSLLFVVAEVMIMAFGVTYYVRHVDSRISGVFCNLKILLKPIPLNSLTARI